MKKKITTIKVSFKQDHQQNILKLFHITSQLAVNNITLISLELLRFKKTCLYDKASPYCPIILEIND